MMRSGEMLQCKTCTYCYMDISSCMDQLSTHSQLEEEKEKDSMNVIASDEKR